MLSVIAPTAGQASSRDRLVAIVDPGIRDQNEITAVSYDRTGFERDSGVVRVAV
jgi:hypothetical protein